MFQFGKKIILVLFTYLAGISTLHAQESYYVLKNLKPEWMIINQEEDKLIPYLPSIHSDPSVVHFYLYTARYLQSELRLSVPEKTGIFIENSLIDYNESSTVKIYRIDSIYREFGRDSILFSLYSNNNINDIRTVITTDKKLDVLLSDNTFLKISQLNRPVLLEFMKIAILMLLLMYAFIINNSRKVFFAYHNISNTFSRISTDEFLNRSASLTGIDLLYFATLSVLMSLYSLIIIYHEDLELVISGISSLIEPVLSWIFILGIIFIWYMIRVFIISIFADLFQIREFKTVHIYEFLRINSFFSLVTFLILLFGLFVFNLNLDILGKIITGLVLWFSVSRMLIISLKFLNSRTHKKLYLFTYLCIVEFIPAIIGLKYLFKSSFLQYII